MIGTVGVTTSVGGRVAVGRRVGVAGATVTVTGSGVGVTAGFKDGIPQSRKAISPSAASAATPPTIQKRETGRRGGSDSSTGAGAGTIASSVTGLGRGGRGVTSSTFASGSGKAVMKALMNSVAV